MAEENADVFDPRFLASATADAKSISGWLSRDLRNKVRPILATLSVAPAETLK